MTDSMNQIRTRLLFVYGEEIADSLLPRITSLAEKYTYPASAKQGWSEKDALLISYADSILGEQAPIRELHRFLKTRTGEAQTFVHLLPFYPFTSDDGFSVVDFREVRADLGSWEDLEFFASDYRLVYDGVINHVSASSAYVRGFLEGDPNFQDFCISLPPDTDTSSVLRTRNLPLLHEYDSATGKVWLWTTFSRDQVDLNFSNPEVLMEILDVMLF